MNIALIGRNVRLLREEQGLTQAELARKLDVDSTYIASLERGDTVGHPFQAPHHLQGIAAHLGVSLDRLYQETTEAVKQALQFVLKEYDKDTIISIFETEDRWWGNQSEALNHTDIETVKRILNEIS